MIYGIGQYSRHLFHLLQHYKINILCFAVKNKNGSLDYIEGCPVREVKDLNVEEVAVVLMGNESSASDELNYLREYGFKNVLFLDKQEFWLADIDIYNRNPKGDKICPICENKFKLFLPTGVRVRFNAVCPYCGSLERHRMYWMQWKNVNLLDNKKMKILHFAPERCFLDKIKKMDYVEYYPVDIDPKVYGIKDKVDITDIQYEDNIFDVIICNHVLEHIPDERKALSELKRVLKTEGIAFLSVPLRESMEVTLEEEKYNTPELREKYYGQADHVRAYGRDYINHLKLAGFDAKKFLVSESYTVEEIEKYGLKKNESMYICRKT